MVNGASQIARTMGISERVIGLTILAIGTSLPEIGASLAALRKGEGALSVGNILGSCLFNQTFVIGSAGFVCIFTCSSNDPVLRPRLYGGFDRDHDRISLCLPAWQSRPWCHPVVCLCCLCWWATRRNLGMGILNIVT